MTAPAIIAALASKNSDAMRAALIADYALFIPTDTDPLTYDPREAGGAAAQVVIWQEKLWFRDETSVAAHDEISVITLADGVNYLVNDIRIPEAVLSYSVTDPPNGNSPGPDYGDAYLIPAASTGTWASHEDEVAIWTSRGWVYVVSQHGQLVYVEDELGYYHFTAADAWQAGVGAYGASAGSVRPSDLLVRSWAFENQTTNTPPSTGPAGETYIIGGTPTGAWAGQAKKIAWRPATDAAFVITAPFVGEKGYDKNLAIDVAWSGASWASATGILIGRVAPAFTASTGSTSTAGTGAYSYSNTVAPTTTLNRRQDDVTRGYTARKVGTNSLRVRYSALLTLTNPNGDIITAALFRDSETNAVAWQPTVIPAGNTSWFVSAEFVIDAADVLSHTYKIGFLVLDVLATSVNTLARRLFQIEEFS